MSTRAIWCATIAFVSLIAAACGPDTTALPDSAPAATGNVSDASTVNWQTLGCDEPPPLVVESSAALEQDVGSAADSLAADTDTPIEETKRQLRLQETLSARMQQIISNESGRVIFAEVQYEPYFSHIVSLTGSQPVTEPSRDLLCATPELEVRLNAGDFPRQDLLNEQRRLNYLFDDFAGELISTAPGRTSLEFEVTSDDAAERLEAVLSAEARVPYTVTSMGLLPFEPDPSNPFPLIVIDGIRSGEGRSGTVTIEGSCAYLNGRLMVLSARDTIWDAEARTLDLGYGPVGDGDEVWGGGYDASSLDLQGIVQPPAPSCRTDVGVDVIFELGRS